MKERLQRILSSRGIASRRRAEELIAGGLVTVNGIPAALGDTADPDTDVFYRKLGRREAFTAAIVTVAGKLEWVEDDRINLASLAVGGGANQPTRLEKAECYLTGKTLEMVDWKAVYQFVLTESSPTTDAFLTGDYKKKVAANLIVSELQRLTSAKAQRKEQVYEV